MKRIILAVFSVISVAAFFLAQAQQAQKDLAGLIQAGSSKAALERIAAGADVNQPQPDGTTPLQWAVNRLDYDVAAALLAKKANVNVTNEFGVTPLTDAARQSDARLVKMLLDAGAKVDSANQDGETALMLAIKGGDLSIVEVLIKAGANVNNVEKFHNQTPLMYAAAATKNAAEMVKLLLAKDADVRPRALYSDWPSQVTSEPRTQYRSTGGLNALLYASRAGCYACVEALIAAGADVNLPTPEGVTPLMTALDNEHNDVAKLLMDKGANPHVWDWWGRTALYIAVDRKASAGGGGGGGLGGFGGGAGKGAAKGGGGGAGKGAAKGGGTPAAGGATVSSLSIINALLDAGVDPNSEMNMHRPNAPGRGRFGDNQLSTGTTPLFRAVQLNDMESVQALLAKGASPNINSMGYTPFLLAAGSGPGGRGGVAGAAANTAMLDLMIQHNADINAKVTGTKTWSMNVSRAPSNNEGTTALHTAAQTGNVSLVRYLLEKGANPNILDANGKKPIEVVGVRPVAPGGTAAQGKEQPAAAPAGAKGKGGPGINQAALAEIRTLLQDAAAKN